MWSSSDTDYDYEDAEFERYCAQVAASGVRTYMHDPLHLYIFIYIQIKAIH